MEVHGDARGVIDHNRFIDNWYTSVVVYGSGEQSWKEPLTLGSGNAVYVEDNYFTQKNVGHKTMAHHIASNNGSRYVFRYNIIEDGYMASHSIDAHGNKYGWKRGSRSYEIYGNKIKAIHRWAGINIRGGDGVIFDNEIEGEFISPLHLMHEGRQGMEIVITHVLIRYEGYIYGVIPTIDKRFRLRSVIHSLFSTTGK